MVPRKWFHALPALSRKGSVMTTLVYSTVQPLATPRLSRVAR
ncbi:hypothetical protein PS691_03704 [Pseudomonas fluorescens]|uniref:Uncharacterized protein n=1 Tax=Pseudomonas fluorescens TaxID=294 RepID=A0A5E7DYN9_PSEFL|nr:hypothetical protein PS691_03704 [Pseudomonas fluorescens]